MTPLDAYILGWGMLLCDDVWIWYPYTPVEDATRGANLLWAR